MFYRNYLLCTVAPYLEILCFLDIYIYIYTYMYTCSWDNYEHPICSYSSMFHYVLFGDPLFEIFLQIWGGRSRWCISSRLTMAFRRTIAAGNRYKDQTPRVQSVNPFCSAATIQIRYKHKVYTESILAMPYIYIYIYIWPWEMEDHA